MRAQEQRKLYRTVNDTDPWTLRLHVIDDTGTVNVSDAATVAMHIATSPVTTIAGVPRGDSLGYFTFATSGISDPVDGVAWEVQVTDGGVVYTLARGTISEADEIN